MSMRRFRRRIEDNWVVVNICLSLGSVKNEASLTRYFQLEVMTTADLAEIASLDMGDWLDTSQTNKCVKTGNILGDFFGTFLAADLAGNTSLSGALEMLKVDRGSLV